MTLGSEVMVSHLCIHRRLRCLYLAVRSRCCNQVRVRGRFVINQSNDSRRNCSSSSCACWRSSCACWRASTSAARAIWRFCATAAAARAFFCSCACGTLTARAPAPFMCGRALAGAMARVEGAGTARAAVGPARQGGAGGRRPGPAPPAGRRCAGGGGGFAAAPVGAGVRAGMGAAHTAGFSCMYTCPGTHFGAFCWKQPGAYR